MLYEFRNGVHKTCCPIDYVNIKSKNLCAGCQSFSGNTCQRCLGGFQRNPDNTCTRCSNVNTFLDKDGNSCATYVEKGWCANGDVNPVADVRARYVYKQLSAADACCACGGGIISATPFSYKIAETAGMGLVGAPFSAKPVPRTANSYFASEGCELDRYGLTLDGNTGVISGTPTTEEPFDLKCTVTARQMIRKMDDPNESILKPRYVDFNATVFISIKPFGLYRSDDGTKKLTKAAVFDEDSFLHTYKPTFSTKYAFKNPSWKIKCAPRVPLDIDGKTGSIKLSGITSKDTFASTMARFNGGAFVSESKTPTQNENTLSSKCYVHVTDDAQTVHMSDFRVFIYPPRPQKPIIYAPTAALRVTVGQPVIEKLSLGYEAARKTDKSKYTVNPIPTLYSVESDCTSSTGVPVERNVVTGAVTVAGLPVFSINPITGMIGGSPHVGLRDFMPNSPVRSSFTIYCDIYAAVASADLRPDAKLLQLQKKLVVQVDSDTCWVTALNYKTPEKWRAMLKDAAPINTPDAVDCKARCEKSKSCAGYYFKSRGICHELVMVPPEVPTKPELALPRTGQAEIKIANCQLHQTCVDVNVQNNAYLSGLYCPVVTGAHTTPLPIYKKPGLNVEDSFYLQQFRRESVDSLPKGCNRENTAWVFRKASIKGDDMVDIERDTSRLTAQSSLHP